MSASIERKTQLTCYALLILIGVAAYSNAPWGKYVYDDTEVISRKVSRDSEALVLDSPASALNLFTKQYSPTFGELSYRPVVSLSYYIDALLFCRRAPLSRMFDIALHIAVALTLFNLWWRLFGSRRVAFFSAALFVAHPIATEVVNSPGFREEILCLLFMLASMHALMQALGEMDGRPSKRWAWLAAALWLLALLSKEPAAMMPVLFGLALVRSSAWRGVARLVFRVHPRTVLWAILPLAIAFVVYAALYTSLQYEPEPGVEIHAPATQFQQDWPGDRGPVLRFLNFTRSFVLYARLWLCPVGLSINHWFQPSDSLADWRLYAGLAGFLVFVALGAGAWLKRSEPAGFGAAWTLVMLVPLMQVIPTPELVAERYMYLPHAGLSLLVATFVLRLGRLGHPVARGVWEGMNHDWRRLALAAAIVVLIVLTHVRNRDWRDDATINLAAYEQWNNAEGYLAMGAVFYRERRDLEMASRCFDASIRLDHRNPEAHRSLGLVLIERGDLKMARYFLETAKHLAPDDGRTRAALHVLEKMASEKGDDTPSDKLKVSPQSPRSPSSEP